MNLNWKFQGGGGGGKEGSKKKKTLHGGGVYIIWNHTMAAQYFM